MGNFLKKFREEKLKRADSLLEVIIALFVVAMGASIATNLIVNAVRSNVYSKNNLIAMNLAAEGLEAVRDIRDSNWLKFSFDRDHCWNMRPEATVSDTCDTTATGKLIEAGNYTVDLNPTSMKWGLSAPSLIILDTADPIPPTSAQYQLHYLDIDDTNGIESHDLFSSNTTFGPGSHVTQSGDSPFYRMIQISYDVTPDVSKAMTVKSLVVWQETNGVQKVELNTILTDYNRVKVSP